MRKGPKVGVGKDGWDVPPEGQGKRWGGESMRKCSRGHMHEVPLS